MLQDLTFAKNAMNRYEASFVSDGGRYVVQLLVSKQDGQKTTNEVIVYGNLSGMDKVSLANLERSLTGQYLFEVNVPDDVVVTIESINEPISGKVASE